MGILSLFHALQVRPINNWYCIKMGLIIVFSVQFSWAEAAPTTQGKVTFQFEDLLKKVLSHNPDIESARLEFQIKNAEIGPSGAWEDPMISYEYMNYPADTLSPREMGMTGRQIAISQKIPFWGKSGFLKSIAEAEARKAEANLQTAQREVVRDLQIHYNELIFLFRKKDLYLEQSHLLKQVIKVAGRQYETGKISQAEFLTAQLDSAKIESDLLKIDNQIAIIYSEFSHHTGGDDFFKGLRPLEKNINVNYLNKLSQKNIDEILNSSNPRLNAQRAEIVAREGEENFRRRNVVPDLEIMGAYTQREENMNDRGQALVSLKIAFSLPIWSGHKQSEEIKAATAMKLLAENEYKKVNLELQRSIEQIKNELNELTYRIQLYEKSILDLARLSVNSNRLNYLSNRVSFANYMQSLRSQKDVEIEYFEAKFNYFKKVSELEALVGEIK